MSSQGNSKWAFDRRQFLAAGTTAIGATVALSALSSASALAHSTDEKRSGTVKMSDGTKIFYKDWGAKTAPPIVFHHGWPLSADAWDAQLLFFVNHGFRVVAHDRRGHGRSSQTDTGNDMDTYVADVAALVERLNLRGAVHVGHSTGGGEVARYVARARPGRVAKAVMISSITHLRLKTWANPNGEPIAVFDRFRDALAGNRAQFYTDVASGPFYGFNRGGSEAAGALTQDWWHQAMSGGVKSHYDCIKASTETDFTDDLRAIHVPTLVMHGEDDQLIPCANAALAAAKLLTRATFKTYPGLSHGMYATHPEQINADLLSFIELA